MTVHYNVTPGQKLTEEEKLRIKEEIEYAKTLPPQFDDDCPEMSESMLKALHAAVRNRNRVARLQEA